MESRDWSIQEIARLAGTTSRTLRHYDDIGLLPPSRIAANGYRHYDAAALVRLQRILLLRELGLGLPQIAEVVGPSTGSGAQGGGSGTQGGGSGPQGGGSGAQGGGSGTQGGGSAAEASALETHLALLREEQTRLARQIASVESTITALRGGENLMAENMFDGFDHTQYKQEVEDRWGTQAYADGDRWWRGMSDAERTDWQQRVSELGSDWIAAAESGIDPASAEAQELARRHVAWLTGIPGTPAAALRKGPDAAAKAYVIGLGEMYVADPRFGANYATSSGGTQGAEFVRDALRIYAEASL